MIRELQREFCRLNGVHTGGILSEMKELEQPNHVFSYH